MRLLAIQNLNSIGANSQWSPAKLIVLGRRYHIRHWVISGYKKLLTRHEGISDEEATDIGLQESLRIMRMREVPYFADYVDVEIKRVFKDELVSIAAMSKSFISSPDIRVRLNEFGGWRIRKQDPS